MKKNKVQITKNEVRPKVSVLIFIAALIMAGMYVYYMYNIWYTIACSAAIGVLMWYFIKKPGYEIPEEQYKKIINIMIFTAAAFMLVRLFRILSCPGEFQGDEWSDIVEAAYKMNGDRGIFDNSGRNGAALPYTSQTLCSLFLAASRGALGYLKLIPFLMITAGFAAVYYFGRIVRGRNFGIILAFVYASSGWTLFAAREMLSNVYDVFFFIMILALFYDYMKNGGLWKIVAAGFILIAGIFTYGAWIIMIPYVLYLMYEYRKELKKEGMYTLAGFVIASAVAGLIIFLKFKSISAWATGQTVFNSAGFIENILLNLFRTPPQFYLLPIKSSPWFTDKFPILSYTEYFLLAGGVILLLKNVKNVFYRVLLVGFILAHFTLIISTGISHHMRNIMLLPFIIIISGIFLERLMKWRYVYIIILLQCLIFINTAFYMFYDWKNQLDIFTTDQAVAQYINRTYRAGGYLFMHEAVAYGDYPCFLRTKSAYTKTDPSGIRDVIFIMPSLYKPLVKGVFPSVKMKYFYDYDGKRGMTNVLYDVDVSSNEKMKYYFIEIEKVLRQVTVDMWCLEYQKAADECNGYLEVTGNNAYKIFRNTLIKETLFEAYGRMGKRKETLDAISDQVKKSYISPLWYVLFANAQIREKNYDKAMELYNKAYQMAPEWWQLKESKNRVEQIMKDAKHR